MKSNSEISLALVVKILKLLHGQFTTHLYKLPFIFLGIISFFANISFDESFEARDNNFRYWSADDWLEL